MFRWSYKRRIRKTDDELNRLKLVETEIGNLLLGLRNILGEDESNLSDWLALNKDPYFNRSDPYSLVPHLLESLSVARFHKIKSKVIDSLRKESLNIEERILASDRDVKELHQRLWKFRDHLAMVSGQISLIKGTRERKRQELAAHLNEAGTLSFRVALLALLIAGASLVVALIILQRTPKPTPIIKKQEALTTLPLYPSIAVIRQIDNGGVQFVQGKQK